MFGESFCLVCFHALGSSRTHCVFSLPACLPACHSAQFWRALSSKVVWHSLPSLDLPLSVSPMPLESALMFFCFPGLFHTTNCIVPSKQAGSICNGGFPFPFYALLYYAIKYGKVCSSSPLMTLKFPLLCSSPRHSHSGLSPVCTCLL